MARFLIRRILLGAFVMFCVTVIVFGLYFVDPAGPLSVARRIAGKSASPEVIHHVLIRLHLTDPLIHQYWYFLWGSPSQKGLLQGSLGFDYYHGQSVNTIIGQAAPVTFWLAVGASVIWLVMGVTSGVISAIRPRSLIDRAFTTLALFFYSFPTFVLGLLFVLFFYFDFTVKFHLQWFPAGGYTPLTQDPFEWFHHLILPWITLALVSAAAYTRLTRGSMLDVLGEDYIRTARAKGLRERRVIFRHGVRAAITPVVTIFGLDVGTLLGGAVLTETVFEIPGIGRLNYDAIIHSDFPIVQGTVLLASMFIVVANIVVDIAYAYLDPRIRF